MNLSYPLKNWITTLVAGPIIFLVSEAFSSGKLIGDALGLLFLFLVIGLIFSLPVLLLYIWAFNFMITAKVSDLAIKIIINIGTVICIAGIFLILTQGFTGWKLTLCYSAALLLSGFLYKVDRRKQGSESYR